MLLCLSIYVYYYTYLCIEYSYHSYLFWIPLMRNRKFDMPNYFLYSNWELQSANGELIYCASPKNLINTHYYLIPTFFTLCKSIYLQPTAVIFLILFSGFLYNLRPFLITPIPINHNKLSMRFFNSNSNK